jgi:predicted CoA-binding protein
MNECARLTGGYMRFIMPVESRLSGRSTLSDPLHTFFYPRGVTIIGASDNPTKLSHGVLRNLVTHGYRGPVYPVNPQRWCDAGAGGNVRGDIA